MSFDDFKGTKEEWDALPPEMQNKVMDMFTQPTSKARIVKMRTGSVKNALERCGMDSSETYDGKVTIDLITGKVREMTDKDENIWQAFERVLEEHPEVEMEENKEHSLELRDDIEPVKCEYGCHVHITDKDAPEWLKKGEFTLNTGSEEHPGFKAWQCTDCGSRGVGEFEQLQEHWATCEKYQERKNRKEHPGRWPEWFSEFLEETYSAPDGCQVDMQFDYGDARQLRDYILELEAERDKRCVQLVEMKYELEMVKAREVELIAYSLRRFAKAGDAQDYAKQYIREFEEEQKK